MRDKMRPRLLFIHPEIENIGIEYLSASLKKANYKVDLLYIPRIHNNIAFHFSKQNQDKYEWNQVIDKIRLYKPDVVCFSPFTAQYLWTLNIAKKIKNRYPNIFILFGGVHVNSVPNEVIKQKWIDGIMIGESEGQIVKFCQLFYNKTKLSKLESLWIKLDGKLVKNKIAKLVENIDLLPFPDKDIFYNHIPKQLLDTTYIIMASRGCPFTCSYCANDAYKELYLGQKRLRFRSPRNVVGELLWAKRKYKYKMVEFFDDVLTIDKDRLKEMMVLYKRKIGLPFTCYMHPLLINEEIIRLLKKSGCCWLKMGVQSANESYRRKFLGRNESNEQVIAAADLCHKYKLAYSLDHIFNLPGETEEDLVEAVKLYTRCKPTIINFGTLIYLPGTEIIKHGLSQGILNDRDVKLINQGKDPIVHMSNIELFSHQGKHSKVTDVSYFALFFGLVPIVSSKIIYWLLNINLHKRHRPVPKVLLIMVKVLNKIHAGQMYLYWSVVKAIFYFNLKEFRNNFYYHKL